MKRRKLFSIPEGRYTGTKDYDKVPGILRLVGGSTLAGTGIGAAVGKFAEKYTVGEGAEGGAKVGAVAGAGLKLLVNHLHNPMRSLEFKKLDKALRNQYGIYRALGVTIGDTKKSRSKLQEGFGFNDPNILRYNIIAAIQDDIFTLYLVDMKPEELESISDSLDYYCKMYTGMEYRSVPLEGLGDISYVVQITFTNYQVIVDFLTDIVSNTGLRINVMNGRLKVTRALVQEKTRNRRLREAQRKEEDLDEREFSDHSQEGIDWDNVFESGGYDQKGSVLYSASDDLMQTLIDVSDTIKSRIPGSVFTTKGSEALRQAVNNLGYREGLHYTYGAEGLYPFQLALRSGRLILVLDPKSKEEFEKLEGILKPLEGMFVKSTVNKLHIYIHTVETEKRLRFLLTRILGSRVLPNIYKDK